jgi:8-oxo-dGTP pyrophosphatase MutT (NUDIX family)
MTLDELLAHPDLVRLARSLREAPGREIAAPPSTRWAAIALVLRAGELGELELLLIKRAEAENDPWSGHIAAPGGRLEPADGTLADTAIRETREETGIDVSKVGRVLGALDDVSPSSPVLPQIVVRPYVTVVAATVEIVQSVEVAAAFWVPLSALRDGRFWTTGSIIVRGTPRTVSIFTHGEHTVWGLTERVLRELVRRLS